MNQPTIFNDASRILDEERFGDGFADELRDDAACFTDDRGPARGVVGVRGDEVHEIFLEPAEGDALHVAAKAAGETPGRDL